MRSFLLKNLVKVTKIASKEDNYAEYEQSDKLSNSEEVITNSTWYDNVLRVMFNEGENKNLSFTLGARTARELEEWVIFL